MPIRRRRININIVVNVITPKPPTCAKSAITTCPNRLQCAYVGTVTRPVTHTDVVEVNSAIPVAFPVFEESGSIKRNVPITIATKNPTAIILVVVNSFFLPKRFINESLPFPYGHNAVHIYLCHVSLLYKASHPPACTSAQTKPGLFLPLQLRYCKSY